MQKVTISKRFDFDAAHRLPNVDEDHKCYRMHGHTYAVEIQLAGKPDERGMVVDYSEIAQAWEPLHALLDHHVLNTVVGLENPTTEILAPWIFERLLRSRIGKALAAVKVFESSSTWCEYRPEP